MGTMTSMEKFGIFVAVAGSVLLAFRIVIQDFSFLGLASSVLLMLSGITLFLTERNRNKKVAEPGEPSFENGR